MRRDVYSVSSQVYGQQHIETVGQAYNFAVTLMRLKCFEEAKSLMRKMTPVAQRVLGESDGITFRMRTTYAMALYKHDGATLDHLREAVTTLEDTERIARRVLGGAHPTTVPTTVDIEQALRAARAALRAHESPRRSPRLDKKAPLVLVPGGTPSPQVKNYYE